LTGEKGGGLISLSAKKKPAALKAFYTYKTTTFCPNKGDRLSPGKIKDLFKEQDSQHTYKEGYYTGRAD
jgi:hypothetical protein